MTGAVVDRPPSTRLHLAGRMPVAAVVAAVLAGLHLLLLPRAAGIKIRADEGGYLAIARFLSGGEKPLMMPPSGTYSGGYSFLIAPALRLGATPHDDYLFAVAVNVALAIGTGVVASLLVRTWWPSAPPALVALGGLVAGAYPSTAIYAGFTVSEVAVTLGFTVLALLVARGSGPIAVSAVVVYLYLTHGRAVVLVAVTLAWSVARWLAGHDRAGRTAAAVVVLIVGASTARVLNGFFVDQLWTNPQLGNEEIVTDALTSPSGLFDTFRNAVGQVWYVSIATLGTATLGLAALAGAVNRRAGWRAALAGRSGAAVYLLASIAGVLTISAAFMTAGAAADHRIYGRYVEMVVPALVALGAVGLGTALHRARTTRLAVALTVMVGSASLLSAVRPESQLGGRLNLFNVLGVHPWVALFDGLHVAGFTVAALALGLLVVVLARWPQVALGALAAWFAFASWWAHDHWEQGISRLVERYEQVREVAAVASPGGGRVDVVDGVGAAGTRLHVTWNLDRFVVRTAYAPYESELVLARTSLEPDRDPARPGTAPDGSRLLWIDPDGRIGLYAQPGTATAERAAAAGFALPAGFPDVPLPDEAYRSRLDVRPDDAGVEVTVEHAGGGSPWPNVGPGRQQGRVRLRILSTGRSCGCVVEDLAVALPRSLYPGDRATLSVPLQRREPLVVDVHLVHEGIADFPGRGDRPAVVELPAR